LTKPVRLDAELVRRRLVASRAEAKRVIASGRVAINGIPVDRASTLVKGDAAVTVEGDSPPYVSRGGAKLEGALAKFDVVVADRRWLDVGASTGGFTDRLLQGGAAAVVAVDVGYGQLDWRLRNDPRVIVLERTNVRDLSSTKLPWVPEGVVADLSFISLTLVLPVIKELVEPRADYVLLVKPQFEVGRGAVGKGGVVRDPEGWRHALERVAAAASECELGLIDAVPSPLIGPAGNHEFFVHLQKGETSNEDAITNAIEAVTQ
jgi:23S rRNA (cytidine1920-2'-O)/16S rRNA (cytidine1409-2'-O)-methyltransferase